MRYNFFCLFLLLSFFYSKAQNYPSHSVLSSGKWVKIKVKEEGIYQLTFEELKKLGINEPAKVRIFGNGGKMLPEFPITPRISDLIENKIFIKNNAVYFFAQSPNRCYFNTNSKMFLHSLHLYSDFSYYFLSSDYNSGYENIISVENPISQTESQVVESFDDFEFHEEEWKNLIHSGRIWLGESFDAITSHSFPFSFPNILTSENAKIRLSAVARSISQTSFSINCGNINEKLEIEGLGSLSADGTFARMHTNIFNFLPNADNFSVKLTFNKKNPSDEGWLNFIEINVRRNLSFKTSQMFFRDINSAFKNNIALFRLKNASQNVKIWDVTKPYCVKEIPTNIVSNSLEFKVLTDTLREFIAFDGAKYLKPITEGDDLGVVENQDLHAIFNAEMIIVSHPDFLKAAEELAVFHREKDNLQVIVATTTQVYNEFSSGSVDISAIRDFAKMIYSRNSNSEKPLRYLLLFGDASFDYKFAGSANTNFIPTYEAAESFDLVWSYATDDFFASLNDSSLQSNFLNISVGRLPVQNETEAEQMVAKIKRYCSNEAMGEWRNSVTILADDEDYGSHLEHAEILCSFFDNSQPSFNIEKIYFDAYKQQSGASGQQYPDVERAIHNRMKNGTLIFNYVGHANDDYLAHEHIVGINTILQWNNSTKLPVFVTASCEFSRFELYKREDNFNKVSAGELVLLNPNGGGIALLSAARPVYGPNNSNLNQRFLRNIFRKYPSGKDFRLGDAVRFAKNEMPEEINKSNFILLGDPALQISYPKPDFKIVTTEINGLQSDTLNALEKVLIKGEIRNSQNTKIENFDGEVFVTIFDKKSKVKTLQNDNSSPLREFFVQNNILYKGTVSVKNGNFSVNFIVPKDISYQFGKGKISYYLKNQNSDGNGFSNEIIVGGFSKNPSTDNKGPEIRLFMNNENFENGGITNETPKIFALVSDSSGINTVGNGIGHDITAVIDNNYQEILTLNDSYQADKDTYKSGKIIYSLSKLSEGKHKLRLKIWDIYNNSSETEIEFEVVRSTDLTIKRLFNYPNPFTSHTDFYFEHNLAETNLDVLIQIFSPSGKLVRNIETKVQSNGFLSTPISWDGKDDYGNDIGRGVYFYRLRVRGNGKTIDKFEKLLILK